MRADVHQPPLRQNVIVGVEFLRVERVEKVLRPRNEEPNDGATLFGDRVKDRLRFDAA